MTVISLRPAKGQGIDPPAVRPRSALPLTHAEAMRLRAELLYLRALFGAWARLLSDKPTSASRCTTCGARRGAL